MGGAVHQPCQSPNEALLFRFALPTTSATATDGSPAGPLTPRDGARLPGPEPDCLIRRVPRGRRRWLPLGYGGRAAGLRPSRKVNKLESGRDCGRPGLDGSPPRPDCPFHADRDGWSVAVRGRRRPLGRPQPAPPRPSNCGAFPDRRWRSKGPRERAGASATLSSCERQGPRSPPPRAHVPWRHAAAHPQLPLMMKN